MSITSTNVAGVSPKLDLIIHIIKPEITKGIVVEVNDVNSFSCGQLPTNTYHSVVSIWDTLEGFTDGQTTKEAWNIWDERTGGFMTANKVEHITYKMTGLFTVDEDGTYSFNVSRHHIRDSIKIDG